MLAHTRYPRDVYARLVDEAWDRLSLADDNREVLPGIQILVLGGHTPGSAAYLIETPQGPHLVAGDFLNTYENYQGHPPGLLVSLQDWYQGWERLRALDAIIIPSHDPELKIRYPNGQIA
jgi:glyoxylase-like metal-dependent hydrolase (beta-lactamase superfamily II)